MQQLGGTLRALGEEVEAESMLRGGLEMLEELCGEGEGEESLRVAVAKNNLGLFLKSQARRL